jgi:hypothetical protein
MAVCAVPPSTSHAQGTVFAVISDYGQAGTNENAVATLVKSWNPEFIVTAGDNNLPSGAAGTIDANIGQYYHNYIYPYTGSYGAGAATNLFFPALGNHDWLTTNAQPYLDYFTLPGNERYYDFAWGPVHIFILDSATNEPDGYTSTSTQGVWLQAQLAAASEPWKLVAFHHPPYSSGTVHGSTAYMQWPFEAWGATATVSGHDHGYERVVQHDFPYFVDGLGGQSKSGYSFTTPPVSGSAIRYNSAYGAMRVEATTSDITFQFISTAGTVVETYYLTNALPLSVNFCPSSASSPSGYRMDSGASYGPHVTHAFGWLAP